MARLVGKFVCICFYLLVLQPVVADIPDYYSEAGYSNEREYQTQQAVEHIDPFTGALQLEHVDLVAPGNIDIVVRRTYRSPPNPAGYLNARTPIGFGWDMHFGRVRHGNSFSAPSRACGTAKVSSQSNPVLELSDGTRKVLVDADLGNNYGYISKDQWIGICLAGGGIEVVSPAGMRYTFDHFQNYANNDAWHVTHIEDKFGNALDISYLSGTGQALIDQVTARDGRTVSFHYDDTSKYGVVLKNIKLNNRTQMSYHHTPIPDILNDTVSFLDRAERPEEGDWNYTYYQSGSSDSGLYALQQMENPLGARTNYEYTSVQFGGGVFSSSTVVSGKSVGQNPGANGNWIYRYTPGTGSDPIDTTTIRSSLYCTVYKHRGAQSINNGEVWKIGTLLEKHSYNASNCTALIQSELYGWTNIAVAAQNEYHRRNNAADNFTYRSVLNSKTITRDGSTYSTTYRDFDSYGNPQEKVENGSNTSSRTTRYTYDNFDDTDTWILGQIATEAIPSIGSIRSDYYTSGVKRGSLSSRTRFGVKEVEYNYFTSGAGLGNVSSITDAENNTTQYSDYYRGVPKTENGPEGVDINRNVNSSGNITSEENGRGLTTRYTYDNLNRITSIITARTNDSDISVSWSNGGRTRQLDRGIFSSVQETDQLGQVIQISAEGITIDKAYNIEGQLTFESFPSSVAGTIYEYDVLGRVTKATNNADASNIRYSYLSQNRVRVTDKLDNITTYTYQSYGDPNERYLISIEAPESITTDISRNDIGNIISVTQGGLTRNYGYDSRQFLVSETHPETGVTTLTRDNSGNIKSKRVGTSSVSAYNYDGLNRLVSINYPGSAPDEQFSYDKNNNVLSASKGISSWVYSYDENDNLLEETLTLQGVPQSFEIRYGYDLNDVTADILYPSGQLLTFSPDSLGRPTIVGNYVTSINYFPNGQASQLIYGNGAEVNFGQDPKTLLPTYVASSIQSQLIQSLSYRYDHQGNITRISDNISGSMRTLGYDDVYRLTSASGRWGGGTISYSDDGNILIKRMGGKTQHYNYDNNNLLSSVYGPDSYNFDYDDYGNITTDGNNDFLYGDDLNLSSVQGPININYEYDANRNRVLQDKDGKQIVSIYNRSGLLLSDFNLSNETSIDHIYFNRQRIASLNYCDETKDGDGDGIPSCKELELGLDPANPADALDDIDGDQLNNLQEFQNQTDMRNPDTDGDQMSDGFEVQFGLDPIDAADASIDSDGDGYTNLDEFYGKSDPLDTASLPNGSVNWSVDLGFIIPEDDETYGSGGVEFSLTVFNLLHGLPALGSDGTIYASSNSGKLFAVDPTGNILWTYDTDPNCIGSVAVGQDNTVYVGCQNGRFHAVAPNGTSRWIFPKGGFPAIDANNNLYFVNNENGIGKLYALSETGVQLWENAFAFELGNTVTIAENGMIYVYGYTNQDQPDELSLLSCSSPSLLLAIDPTGNIQWTREYEGLITGAPAIGVDGSIYIGSVIPYTSEYLLSAINADGTTQWENKKIINGPETNSPPAPVIDKAGNIYIYNLRPFAFDPAGAELPEWSCSSCALNGIESSSILAEDGQLYSATENGIIGFTQSGQQLWAQGRRYRSYLEPAAGAPLLGQDGTLYAVNSLGSLYAVKSGGQGVVSKSIWPMEGQNSQRTHSIPVCSSLDSDLDGIPDCYENRIGMDANNPADAQVDTDGDLLTNHDEYRLKTHPHNRDSDGDGIDDKAEFDEGLNPRSNVPGLDSDGDGATDLIEYMASTKMGDPSSTPIQSAVIWSAKLAGAELSAPLLASENGSTIHLYEQPLFGTAAVVAFSQLGTLLWEEGASSNSDTTPGVVDQCSQHYTSINDGQRLWRQSPTTGKSNRYEYSLGGRVSSPFALSDTTIYVVREDLSSNTFALKAYSKFLLPLWSTPLPASVSATPAIDVNGNIYLGAADGNLYAINKTGTLLWSYQTGAAIQSSPAIAADGSIYIGSDNHKLYKLAADGSLIWEFETGGIIDTSPVTDANGNVYVTSNDNSLYAISSNGVLIWRYDTAGPIRTTPTIGLNGIIYFGSNDGYVYAVDSAGTLAWRYNTGAPVETVSPLLTPNGLLHVGNSLGDISVLFTTSKGVMNSSWPMLAHDYYHTSNVTDSLTIDNEPPQLLITNPTQTTFVEGESISFSATAVDAEDGDISAFIQWTSDVDGDIGVGAAIVNDTLSRGNHVITASITDASGAVTVATLSIAINETTPLITLVADQLSPQIEGQIVQLNAAIGGSSIPYEYRFQIKGPSTLDKWQVLQGFSVQASFAWDSTGFAGKNVLRVQARPQGSADTPIKSRQVFWINQINPAETISLSADLTNPQITGAQVAVTAAVSGQDSGPYEYQFEVNSPVMGSGWLVLRDYSASPTIVWDSTNYLGKNVFRVSARKAGTNDKPVKERLRFWINEPNPAQKVSLNSDISSPQLAGTLVALTATAIGGIDNNYEYLFQIRGAQTNGEWVVLRDFAADPVYLWDTQSYLGQFDLRVQARNAGTSDKPVRKRLRNYDIQ